MKFINTSSPFFRLAVLFAVTAYAEHAAIAASDVEREVETSQRVLSQYQDLFQSIQGLSQLDVGQCQLKSTGSHSTEEIRPTTCVRVGMKTESQVKRILSIFGASWLYLNGAKVEFLHVPSSGPQPGVSVHN